MMISSLSSAKKQFFEFKQIERITFKNFWEGMSFPVFFVSQLYVTAPKASIIINIKRLEIYQLMQTCSTSLYFPGLRCKRMSFGWK